MPSRSPSVWAQLLEAAGFKAATVKLTTPSPHLLDNRTLTYHIGKEVYPILSPHLWICCYFALFPPIKMSTLNVTVSSSWGKAFYGTRLALPPQAEFVRRRAKEQPWSISTVHSLATMTWEHGWSPCCFRSLDLLLKGINIHLSRFCPWNPRGPKPGLWRAGLPTPSPQEVSRVRLE